MRRIRRANLIECVPMSKRILLAGLAAAFALGVQAQSGLKAPSAKSGPKPAAAQKKPAAEEENPGVKEIRKIFACLAAGLPGEWRRAWVVLTEIASDGRERSFEGAFYYSLDPEGAKPEKLVPCNAREVGERVYALNEFLEPEKRHWKVATLVFLSEGKFELKYDYAQ
jgi:hypothetical protein